MVDVGSTAFHRLEINSVQEGRHMLIRRQMNVGYKGFVEISTFMYWAICILGVHYLLDAFSELIINVLRHFLSKIDRKSVV